MMYAFGDSKTNDPRSVSLMETLVRRHILELCAGAARTSQQRAGTIKFTAEVCKARCVPLSDVVGRILSTN